LIRQFLAAANWNVLPPAAVDRLLPLDREVTLGVRQFTFGVRQFIAALAKPIGD
jgi:hypothetical protein